MTKTSARAKNSRRGKKFTAYRGHVISPKSVSTLINIPNGALVVDDEGKIVEVGEWTKLKRSYNGMVRVIDYGEKLIAPGFVDLHLHLPQIPQTGRSGKTLLGWLDSFVFPAEARFADTRHARKIANWFFDELARNGTTLSAVFTTIHKDATNVAFEIAAAKGHRVIMGKVMMDAN
ncbi:MAG: amidohydrolase family protein, partial [Candidatus Obscuribacterales bacterium]|nr:amidohydrolase family protein [Candidatus Obscuribacterales bacterium]